MNDLEETEWTTEEMNSVRRLADRGASLRPALKTVLVRRLRDLGLVSSTGSPRWVPWVAAAAFALIGFGFGRGLTPPQGGGVLGGTRYVLLLTGAESVTPEENDARRREYKQWIKGLKGQGMVADGAELVGVRHQLSKVGASEPVVGYFVINARDESQALAIAKANPHLTHGGGITVSALR